MKDLVVNRSLPQFLVRVIVILSLTDLLVLTLSTYLKSIVPILEWETKERTKEENFLFYSKKE